MALDAGRPAQHGAAMVTRLETIIVDKPWGRVHIPRDFGDFGDRRVGEIWFAHPVGDDAPIMVKFLFTSARLSLQVNPDDEAAAAASYPRGKQACYLVLAAGPAPPLGGGLNTTPPHAPLPPSVPHPYTA